MYICISICISMCMTICGSRRVSICVINMRGGNNNPTHVIQTTLTLLLPLLLLVLQPPLPPPLPLPHPPLHPQPQYSPILLLLFLPLYLLHIPHLGLLLTFIHCHLQQSLLLIYMVNGVIRLYVCAYF